MKQWTILLATFVALLTQPGSALADQRPQQYDHGKTYSSGDGTQAGRFGNEITSSTPMPMYDAFRRFCLTTGAQPEAIEKAVMISGISFHKRGPTTTANPMPTGTTAWDMDFEGHRLTLNAGHSTEGDGTAMVQKGNSCSITSWNGDEKASVAALHKWAGISRAADRPIRQGTLTLYEFEVRGTAMIPLKNDDAGRLAKTEGRTWLLTIMDNSVMLAHYSPPFPRP